MKVMLQIRYDGEWEEWTLDWYDWQKESWKKNNKKTYHTDSQDDAKETLKAVIKEQEAKGLCYRRWLPGESVVILSDAERSKK
ncbi:MAG: hypothetical protein ACXABF_17505 [Candidatus Thorarchaeota archaeon]|jgi:hypothetical protein